MWGAARVHSGPLLFLIQVNDMPQAVKLNLFLYADDSFLVFQGKDVTEIEKQLNEDFTNICEWFVDNRLRRVNGSKSN